MSGKVRRFVTGLCVAGLLCGMIDGAQAAKQKKKDKAKPTQPSAPPPAAPDKPVSRDYSDPLRIEFVGTIVSIDTTKRTLTVKGESRQQGKTIGRAGTHTFVLGTSCFISTPKKIIATLDDLVVNDAVEITYGKSGEQYVATSLTVPTGKSTDKKPEAGKGGKK